MASRVLLGGVLLLVLGVGPGCYYTVTRDDGTTERISRQEYNELRSEGRTQSHVGTPNIMD